MARKRGHPDKPGKIRKREGKQERQKGSLVDEYN